MRALSVLLLLTALLTGSAVAREARSPCDVVSKPALRAALGGEPVAPDPATIGEETAPSCIWTVRGSNVRLKIEIWSGDELAVVGAKSARAYFVMRRREALNDHVVRFSVSGSAAFRTRFEPAGGEIGVLKDRRFLAFTFERIPLVRARRFAKAVVRRL